jgi:transcription elongation factor Elf1
MAQCPHCNQPLSTYTTVPDSDPRNIEVLICAQCDKLLGVVGPV